MDQLEIGFAVFSVDDRRMGQVSSIRDCCFEIQTRRGKAISLLPYVIFNIADGRISLVCNEGEIDRYACSNHP